MTNMSVVKKQMATRHSKVMCIVDTIATYKVLCIGESKDL